jgi:hypothetical protein
MLNRNKRNACFRDCRESCREKTIWILLLPVRIYRNVLCSGLFHSICKQSFNILSTLIIKYVYMKNWRFEIHKPVYCLRCGYTMQFSLQLVSQWRCDTSCGSVYTVQRWHKLLQSLPKVEANSTFGNDCCNLSRKIIMFGLQGRLDGEKLYIARQNADKIAPWICTFTL